jgi:citrate synthase
MAEAHPVDVLRTAISALGALDPGDRSRGAMDSDGIRLIARVPTILIEHQAARTGREPIAEGPGHALRLLSGIRGARVAPQEARTLDRCLILLSEHGSNASAFAARVAIGTGSDLHAAVTAAVAAFSGPLHGGAIEGVTEMVEEIGEPHRAAAWVAATRARKEPVLGLGHRVYRSEDPRAAHLRRIARRLSRGSDDTMPFLVLEAVRKAMRPHTRFGVDVNVDFYAGLALTHLGVPPDMLTAVFGAARVVGWVAQCLEQRDDNVLIRPLLRYQGAPPRAYLPIEARPPGRGWSQARRGRMSR